MSDIHETGLPIQFPTGGPRDPGIAVNDAKRLNECWRELSDEFAALPAQDGDELLWSREVNASAPTGDTLDWIHRCNSEDVATVYLRRALQDKSLVLWIRLPNSEEVVDANALPELSDRAFRAGACLTDNYPKSHLERRPLWIKTPVWRKFLSDTLSAQRERPAPPTINFQASEQEKRRDWLRLSKAVRILHRILRTRLAGQEPTPWIDPPTDPFDADREGATHRHRRTARTSLTMRRALLSGDLNAHLVKNDHSHPLPGWAWQNACAAENAFNFNWLPLNPLLRHGLGEFGDWRCFVPRAEFRAWIARSNFAEIGDLPTLPAPFDCDAWPDQLSYLEPPNRPFIELTQALTWIAFAVSVSRDEFSYMESCRFGPFAETGWRNSLCAAITSFADQGSAGNVRVRGRYVANYSDRSAAAQADTAYLSDTQMRDFARWDALYGGLERGTGSTWEADPLNLALFGPGDGWRDVEVCRADLMLLYPPKVNSGIGDALPPIQSTLARLPLWLNPYQLEAWVQYRDLSIVAKASDWDGLAAQHMYGEEPKVGSVADLMEALQGGDIPAQGQINDAMFRPIAAVEWTRIALAPRDLSRQHPFMRIQFKREDVLARFPTIDSKGGKVAANRQLDHEKIRERAKVMLEEQPGLSKGSAAASIVAELPRNPKTGKPRDQRGIERIIAPLWERKAA